MPILIWFILFADAITGQKPVQRTPEAQAAVDSVSPPRWRLRTTSRPRPYRRRVFPEGDACSCSAFASTLPTSSVIRARRYAACVKGGGKKAMVPCLYIEEAGGVRWLYESADIAHYLRQRASVDDARRLEKEGKGR